MPTGAGRRPDSHPVRPQVADPEQPQDPERRAVDVPPALAEVVERSDAGPDGVRDAPRRRERHGEAGRAEERTLPTAIGEMARVEAHPCSRYARRSRCSTRLSIWRASGIRIHSTVFAYTTKAAAHAIPTERIWATSERPSRSSRTTHMPRPTAAIRIVASTIRTVIISV